jgi:hypothetical protein
VPSYFGPLRPGTEPDGQVNLIIPSLLHSMWERHRVCPTFRQNVEVKGGVLRYKEG